MAILNLTQQPSRFASAYKPMEFVFTSQKSPVNSAPGESNIGVASIGVATAGDVIAYGAPLEVGDVFVVHGFSPLTNWPLGQMITLSQGVSGHYNGEWRVLKQVSTTVTVIDAEDLGSDTGGRISKFYENYSLIASIVFADMPYAVEKNIIADPDGNFVLDVSDVAQRVFDPNGTKGDIFKIAEPDQPFALIDAEGYITAKYTVSIIQGYMVPDANGNNVYFRAIKPQPTITTAELIAVNSVQPYHHIDEQTGETDLLWDDNLAQYEVAIEPGLISRRFLTYRPLGGELTHATYDPRIAQRVGPEDDLWLAFLWGLEATNRLSLRISAFTENGFALGSTDTAMVPNRASHLFNAGPNALTLPSGTHHYRISIANDLSQNVVGPIWATVDTKCDSGARFYYLNAFGAIDQYTLESKVSRETSIKRRTVTRDGMRTTPGRRGDYNRRTVGSEILRSYSGTTRTENKAVLRYLSDELVESSDVRTLINKTTPSYTYVIMEVDKASMGAAAGRLRLEWSLGVDNRKQRR